MSDIQDEFDAALLRYREASIKNMVELMDTLDEEQRLEVMAHFCNGCGCHQPEGHWCQCQNDE